MAPSWRSCPSAALLFCLHPSRTGAAQAGTLVVAPAAALAAGPTAAGLVATTRHCATVRASGWAADHSLSGTPPVPARARANRDPPTIAGATVLASAAALAGAAAATMRRGHRSPGRGRLGLHAAGEEAPTPPVVLKVEGVLAQSVDEAKKKILKGLDLVIREGEVHAVMGPNGSGKSTLAKVLVGDSAYEVTDGHASFGEDSLFDMEPHERALAGLFLAFQSPPEINGVSNLDFLRATYNAKRRANNEAELDVIEFYGLVSEKVANLKISPDFLNRNVNEGFSGGERKRNEMLQMSVLEPKLAILDEIDSGLDIDALKDVADTIAAVRGLDTKRSLLVVTHFERFLKYIDADFVHVMHQGRIVKSGGRDLSRRLDAEGYDWIIRESKSK